MNVSDGKAVKEASPEGVPEQEGGLDSPDCVLRSGEVAKKDRQLARHCTGYRTVRASCLYQRVDFLN